MDQIRYLTTQEVIAINTRMINHYSPDEILGVKAPDMLESAVNRPMASFGGEDLYPDIFSKAGALLESLAQNHPFNNANKRTAYVATAQFLRYNGYRIKMGPVQVVEFVLDVVNHQITFEDIVVLLDDHCI